ncbi:MAG: cation:proton antiporter, partial [Myxococcota bacterium]
MHEVRTVLQDLALVFLVAGAVTLLFRRIRQPVVLGYLLAGMLLGPDVPFPLFADQTRVQSLSELGVVLVMFSLGVEFSFSKLLRLLPTSGISVAVQVAAMMWLGFTVGQLFGISTRESVFVGAMVAISSTMIVARVFAAERVDKRLQDTVLGLLIMQDLAAVILIAVMTAVAGGAGLPAGEVLRTVGELLLFLVTIIVGGMFVVPRLVRYAARARETEALLVVVVGVCFGFALLAEQLGYSVALGAFVAGTLVGESGRRRRVDRLIAPLRDVFAAVFFVSVGMLVDPQGVVDNWALVLSLTALVVVGMTVFHSLGVFLTGGGVHLAVRSGMSLAQIGEFGFIMVAVGVAGGAVSPVLYAVAVAVSVLTAFLTPLLVRASEPTAIFVERHLPRPLHTFTCLYGSWVESLRARGGTRIRGRIGRLWRHLGVDGGLLLLVVLGASFGRHWLAGQMQRLGLSEDLSMILVLVAAGLATVPFAVGVVRVARELGAEIGRRAMPETTTGLDLAEAPRRAFVLSIQLGLVLLVGLPLVAATQPLLPLGWGAGLLILLLAGLGIAFWTSTTNLEGH